MRSPDKKVWLDVSRMRDLEGISHAIRRDYDPSKHWGVSTYIDLKKCDPDKIRCRQAIEDYIIQICDLLKVRRFEAEKVPPVNFGDDPRVRGYTFIQPIETSHIGGHFREKDNGANIDIFTCSFYSPAEAVRFTQNYFGAWRYRANVFYRY